MLRTRSSVLERAVEGREEQIEILRLGARQPPARIAPLRSSGSGGSSAARVTEQADGSSRDGSPPPSDGGVSSSASGSQVVDGGNGAIGNGIVGAASAAAAAAAGGSGDSGSDASDVAALLDVGAVPSLEEIRRLGPEGLRALWRRFLQLASKALVALDDEERAGAAAAAASEAAASAAAGAGVPALEAGGAAAAAAAGNGAPAPRAMDVDGSASASGAEAAGGNGAEAAAGGGGGGGSAAAAAPRPNNYGARRPPPPGPAAARLHALVDRYVGVIKHVILLTPGAAYALAGRDLETGAPLPAGDGFWRGVVSQLRLSAVQVQDLLAIHELFEFQAARVLAERAALQAQLASCAGGGAGGAGMVAAPMQ